MDLCEKCHVRAATGTWEGKKVCEECWEDEFEQGLARRGDEYFSNEGNAPF